MVMSTNRARDSLHFIDHSPIHPHQTPSNYPSFSPLWHFCYVVNILDAANTPYTAAYRACPSTQIVSCTYRMNIV